MENRYGIVRFQPELTYSSSGLAVCNLMVEGQKGKLVKLVAFGDVAEEMAEEVSINDEISVTGYFKEYEFREEVTRKFVVKSWKVRR